VRPAPRDFLVGTAIAVCPNRKGDAFALTESLHCFSCTWCAPSRVIARTAWKRTVGMPSIVTIAAHSGAFATDDTSAPPLPSQST